MKFGRAIQRGKSAHTRHLSNIEDNDVQSDCIEREWSSGHSRHLWIRQPVTPRALPVTPLLLLLSSGMLALN